MSIQSTGNDRRRNIIDTFNTRRQPEVLIEEVEKALKGMTHDKTAGNNGIMVEHLNTV